MSVPESDDCGTIWPWLFFLTLLGSRGPRADNAYVSCSTPYDQRTVLNFSHRQVFIKLEFFVNRHLLRNPTLRFRLRHSQHNKVTRFGKTRTRSQSNIACPNDAPIRISTVHFLATMPKPRCDLSKYDCGNMLQQFDGVWRRVLPGVRFLKLAAPGPTCFLMPGLTTAPEFRDSRCLHPNSSQPLRRDAPGPSRHRFRV